MQGVVAGHAKECQKFWLGIEGALPKFYSTPDQNMAWCDTDGPPVADCTLNHYSLDLYGGHGMVQQQLIWCPGWLWHKNFGLELKVHCPNFTHFKFETWHGMTQMGHQELVAH
jgi:hypothetical protein